MIPMEFSSRHFIPMFASKRSLIRIVGVGLVLLKIKRVTRKDSSIFMSYNATYLCPAQFLEIDRHINRTETTEKYRV